MIEDKIEIVIPTYNRADYLDKTLSYLLNSPFKDCKITVRDNASQDTTPEVCEKYSNLFQNMCIIRNGKNIGANANIIRSFEKASYPYVWVLADNDYLNFDKCDDFIEAIESEKYDAIICCSGIYVGDDEIKFYPSIDDEPISEYIRRARNDDKIYLENNAKDLALILKKHYFLIATFISSTIYKTSLIDSETLMVGYDYICQSFPHYSLISKVLNNNLLTYKTKNDVVFMQLNPDEGEITDFGWYSRFLECSTLIKDKEIRSYASENQFRKNIFHNLLRYIVVAKLTDDKSLKRNVLNLIKTLYHLKGWFKGSIYVIYLLICYAIPKRLCDFALSIKLKYNNKNKV